MSVPASPTLRWVTAGLLLVAAVLSLALPFVSATLLTIALGGVAVDRRQHNNLVDAVAAEFASRDALVLGVPAEGTRSRRDYWKSGFYWMASKAEVPIALGYLDFSRREGGFGPLLHPSGDLKADMDVIRAFYADKVGKNPALFTPPLLQAEAEESAEAPLG